MELHEAIALFLEREEALGNTAQITRQENGTLEVSITMTQSGNMSPAEFIVAVEEAERGYQMQKEYIEAIAAQEALSNTEEI